MHIKRLVLSNFQVIEDLEADFEGNIYLITGDNELGKSTVLKAMGVLLDGKRDEVLRNGTEKGFAKMVVGDDGVEYEVNLSFTKANPKGTFTIKGPNGMSSSNVSSLQKIFGYTDFDAVEFSRWSETAEGRRKQVEVVKSLLPKAARDRMEAIAKERAEVYNSRKDANYEYERASKWLEEVERTLPADVEKYTEKKDVAALLETEKKRIQLEEKAKQATAKRDEIIADLEDMPNRRAAADALLKAAEDAWISAKITHEESVIQLSAIEKDLTDRKERADKWLEEYGKTNISDGVDALKEAEEWNKKVDAFSGILEKRKEKKTAADKANELSERIASLDKEKATIVAKSKLPIEGLSFSEEGLELKGVPFVPNKVSDSQIMEVAFHLTVASNPTVKVFRIARGESLGKERLRSIVEMARKNGFQGFIEQMVRGQEDFQIDEYTEA